MVDAVTDIISMQYHNQADHYYRLSTTDAQNEGTHIFLHLDNNIADKNIGPLAVFFLSH